MTTAKYEERTKLSAINMQTNKKKLPIRNKIVVIVYTKKA